MDEDIFLNICYDAEEFKMEICLFSVLSIKDIKKFTDLIYLKLPEISTVYKWDLNSVIFFLNEFEATTVMETI